VLVRYRVLGGEGEATRLHRPARCCDVGGLCAGPNGQDFAYWIPRPLVAIPGGSCRRCVSTKFVIEFRWAEGRDSRLSALAAELVRLKPDVIVTTGTPGSLATKRATSTIPIVFASSGNPVAAGLVPSFSRPGGNVTGFTVSGPELEGKRVQLLKEVVPRLPA
jgi:ABC transporter substrate binding protein